MVEPLPGMCSNQEPHEGFANFEIRDIETVWSLLAQTDQRAGTGLGLTAVASKRVAGPKPIILQAVERGTALDVLRSGNELERAARTLIALTEAVVAERTASGNEDVWQRAEIGSLSPDYWDDSEHRAHLVRVLIAAGLVVTATAAGPVPLERWTEDLQAAGALREDVARILALMAGKEQASDDTLMERAGAALARVRQGELLPRELFECHFRLLNAMHGGDAEYLGGDALAKMAMQWRAIAERQRCSLTDPNVNCPAIIERCDDSARSGVAKVAYILISVAPAVGARLKGETRAFLDQLARGERYASSGACPPSTG
jgi:hypothetical protein